MSRNTNRHIKIETVDESLVSIYEKDREAFTGILWRNPLWTFSIIGAVILILLKHILWFIPPISLVFIILKYILLPLSVAFIIMPILVIPELFRLKTNDHKGRETHQQQVWDFNVA